MKLFSLGVGLLLSPRLITAQLAVTVSPVRVTGEKAAVPLAIKNDLSEKMIANLTPVWFHRPMKAGLAGILVLASVSLACGQDEFADVTVSISAERSVYGHQGDVILPPRPTMPLLFGDGTGGSSFEQPAAGSGSVTPVPEPGSAQLIALASGFLAMRRFAFRKSK